MIKLTLVKYQIVVISEQFLLLAGFISQAGEVILG